MIYSNMREGYVKEKDLYIKYNNSNIYTSIRSKKEYYSTFNVYSNLSHIPEYDREEFIRYGKCMGVNLIKYPTIVKYVLASIVEPVPKNWFEQLDEKGDIFYTNNVLDINQLSHPMEDYYRAIIKEKKKSLKLRNILKKKSNNRCVIL